MSAFYVFVHADPHECTYNRRGQQMCVSWIMFVNSENIKVLQTQKVFEKSV